MELVAQNICMNIKGKKILENINLNLKNGKIYGFVGENGSGKTMLFRALSGLMRITSGSVILDGKELHKDMSVLPDSKRRCHRLLRVQSSGFHWVYTMQIPHLPVGLPDKIYR